MPNPFGFPDNYGIGVISRRSFEDAQVQYLLERWPPSLRVALEVAGLPVTILAVHACQPLASQGAALRNGQLAALADEVSGIEDPCVVAGDLNTTFGSSGVAQYSGGSVKSEARGVVIDASDRIVTAGHDFSGDAAKDIYVWRYDADGASDAGFNTEGFVTYDGGAGDTAYDVALDSQGRILVTGSSSNGSNNDMIIPVVVLPQPLSPARPRISPLLISRSIPSTAWTKAFERPNMEEMRPVLTGKSLRRFCTLTAICLPSPKPVSNRAVGN